MSDKLSPMEQAREIAGIAWTSAANAYRLYPDNKHTFADYWNNLGKSDSEKILAANTESPSLPSPSLEDRAEKWAKDNVKYGGDKSAISQLTNAYIAGSLSRDSEVQRLREALKAAVGVIKQWHNANDVWEIYYNHAPGMKPIREALASLESGSSEKGKEVEGDE